MSTIITKFSDYNINSIEYFIDKIETELAYRDIKGLTSDKIQKINVSKEHPLVNMVAAELSSNRREAPMQSGVLPAISVTPGNLTDDIITMGIGYKTYPIDSDFVAQLQTYQNQTQEQRIGNVILSRTQIDAILVAYRKYDTSVMIQTHEWYKNEEINISAWTPTTDTDILIGNILDSLMSEISVGFAGDNSAIKNFKFRTTKGLTNFNFGRVIYGTEYGLTFTNTFCNYTVFVDDTRPTDAILTGTKTTVGEDE